MINSKLIAKLKNRKYRDAFVASQINIGIPFQLRALLKASTWTQQQLAEKADMLQPRISAMLKPGGAKFTLETLKRLATAFDVALIVKFVPFSELARWSEEFDPDSFYVPTFEQEIKQQVSVAAVAGGDVAIEASIAQIDEEWSDFSCALTTSTTETEMTATEKQGQSAKAGYIESQAA